jgi:RHS repeat-associated protein
VVPRSNLLCAVTFDGQAGAKAWNFSKTIRTFNAESRMSQQIYGANSQTSPLTTFRYDGRSFLKEARYRPQASRTDETVLTQAVYSSDGVLHQRQTTRNTGPADPRDFRPTTETVSIFHFAGRPVAQYRVQETTPAEEGQLPEITTSLGYLTTDHLGTPIALTDQASTLQWQGGFSPFGEDYSGAEAAGVLLRFPGQWDDAAWVGGEEGYYNVYRWYGVESGRYTRVDPLGLDGGPQIYAYANSSPVSVSDSLGLIAKICCRLLNNVVVGNVLRQRHCYLKSDAGVTYSLFPQEIKGRTVGVPEVNNPDDTGGKCRECKCKGTVNDKDRCLLNEYNAYPVGNYSAVGGPNSNSFAGTLAKACCKGVIPDDLGSAPSIDDKPPAPLYIMIRHQP